MYRSYWTTKHVTKNTSPSLERESAGTYLGDPKIGKLPLMSYVGSRSKEGFPK